MANSVSRWFKKLGYLLLFSGPFLGKGAKLCEASGDKSVKMSEKNGRGFELLRHGSEWPAGN